MSLTSIERKLAELERAMTEAAAGDDFEEAARLRDDIAALRGRSAGGSGGAEAAPNLVHKPPPGAMGLGTNLPVAQRPPGWKPPRRPDPMTRNRRRGKGRS